MTRTTMTTTLHVTISTRPRSRLRRWIGMHLALLGLYVHHAGLHLAMPKIVMDETLEVDGDPEAELDLRTFEDVQ